MNTFTIDSDQNITVHAGLPADADESQSFSSQKDLAKLASDWPASRLVDTWNSFAGVAPFDNLKPVKKFTNRKVALSRIWTAVQRLVPAVAQPAAHVASGRKRTKKSPSKAKRRDVGRDGANLAREGSKKAEVLDLLRRSQGATLAEIMELTGWQAHTVRGFVSGTLTTKLGLKVESFRSEDNERTYRIKA